MSYLVIARKWRPQTFEEVVGQPHVTRTLQNAIRLDRIAHAYLFTGARGVGKTSIARILAKALNCEKGPAPSPCGQCSNCREIAQGNSVDVLEIDGASNRGIDNIRELRETVRYRPAKGRYKVYIIDEVHMLTTEAFNALLKTLEEPPSHVVFIFATTEPHKIPATILSRCQRFDFRRISLAGLVEHLKRITEGEGAHFSDTVLFSIAGEADGSMRDAQSLLEQLLAFSGDGLPDEEILDILGVIDRRSVLRAGEAVVSGDVQGCLDLVEDIYRRGVDNRRFCQHLCDHFRNLLVLSMSDERRSRLNLPDEEKTLLREQASKTSPQSLHLYFQMLLRGEEEIRRSSMPKIALEMLLLRMAQLPKLESLDSLLERIGSLENTLRGELPGGRNMPAGGKGPARSPAPADFPASPRPSAGPAPSSRPVKNSPAPARPEPPPEPVEKAGETGSEAAEAPPSATPPSGAAEPVTPLEDFAPRVPAESEAIPPDHGFSPPVEAPVPEAGGPVPETGDFAPAGQEEPPPPEWHDEPEGAAAGGDPIAMWADFVDFLQNHDSMLWAKVSYCTARAASEGVLELEVPEIYENSANGPQFLEKLSEASQAFFGRRYEWVIIKKERDPAKSGPAAARDRKASKSAGTQVMNHPAIQQAIEILGAELVEIRPAKSPGSAGKARKTGRN